MKVEIIDHESGDQLPILLDKDGLPITMPGEFVLGRRALGTNTLVRNLRELSVLFKWLESEGIDIWNRISSGKGFTEAEIRGGLIESLRREQFQSRKVKKLSVSPNTFNQRLTTIRQFFGLYFDIYLGSIAFNDLSYERIRDQKNRTLAWLDSSFISAPPKNVTKQKGLSLTQAKFLVNCLNPESEKRFGLNSAVNFRNYILVMIMLNYGLRPGEVLSLKVEDIEFGAISCIKVVRRPSDVSDTRRPRPKIKRNGRVMPIDDTVFAKHLDEYIMHWRDVLEANAEQESDYLILNDEGRPLSQPSIVQFFQILRSRFPDDLPPNLTAKSLRHTFSSNMEKVLREVGMDEQRRTEALADLRGDSCLSSQEIYIAQEIQEQANAAMRNYHRKLLG